EPAPEAFLAPALAKAPRTFGLGDPRLVPKVRIGSGETWVVGLAAPVTLPVGAKDSFLGYGAFTINPELLTEFKSLLGLRILADAGFALRPTRQYVESKIGSAVTFGVGGELPMLVDGMGLVLKGTLQGEWVVGEPSVTGKPIELLVGAAWQTPTWSLVFGLGKGFTNGYGEPLVRTFVGASMTP
ncbi:MAG TPA: hypothetical protein VFH51_00030, partial [Myxococcota bacterium]|nr:hypothetical protein [Myxococcota bacterium]